MKAYKMFKADWSCEPEHGKKQVYKVGETYTSPGKPIICKRGFHACKKLCDCFKTGLDGRRAKEDGRE